FRRVLFRSPLNMANEYAKMIPDDPKMTLSKAKTDNPAFAVACNKDPNLQRIMRYAEVLEGLYRNAGVHAAGVVIGDKPLQEIVPLTRDKDGSPVTQYAKKEIEECGLLKMDFLGLKTLTVLQESIDLVKITRGLEVDLENLPLDDEITFELFRRADTVGVFQLESAGMKRVLEDLQPNRIEEIIAILALYRPGPMDMIDTFVRRKKGQEKIVYDHPLLEPILNETYGIMVYQEQVQRAAQVLAGYSLGHADMLRRAMGKKNPKEMAKERTGFIAGCLKVNGIKADRAGQIFDNIEKFAGYGFNKAHAAAYGIVTYQTAYMKAHFPAEFMCAQISSEIGNFDKLPGFVSEADNMGLKVMAPDVNRSFERFIPEDGKILYGLAGIKSVGQGAAEAIVSERRSKGPFKGLTDFCERVDPAAVNKRVLEALIKCGAMDCFGMHRARLFNNIDFALSRASEKLREKASGQSNLFEMLAGADAGSAAPDHLPDFPEWPEKERLSCERELLGVYMTGHPLTRFTRIIKDIQTVSLTDIATVEDKQEIRVAGMAATVTRRISKQSKEAYANLTIDDGTASIEAVVFPKAFRKYENACVQDAPVLVCGYLNREEQPKIYAEEVYALNDGLRLFCKKVVAAIFVNDGQAHVRHIEGLRDVVRKYPGKVPVNICLIYPDKRKIVVQTGDAFNVDPSPDFISEAESLLGKKTLRMIFAKEVFKEPRKDWRRSRDRQTN
ncbi:MAG: DNA polymerase III subunit alpha, partial [Kiritimatiellae bacterium]|nr:DNA polymerase III subunit alpha [Kiritimatiellia bacterium]